MAIIAGGKNMAKIGFIGMGNMGSAILNGLLRVYKPEDLLFTAAHKEKIKSNGVLHGTECKLSETVANLLLRSFLFSSSHIRLR